MLPEKLQILKDIPSNSESDPPVWHEEETQYINEIDPYDSLAEPNEWDNVTLCRRSQRGSEEEDDESLKKPLTLPFSSPGMPGPMPLFGEVNWPTSIKGKVPDLVLFVSAHNVRLGLQFASLRDGADHARRQRAWN